MDAVVASAADGEKLIGTQKVVSKTGPAVMRVAARFLQADLARRVSQQECAPELCVLLELSSPLFADSFEWGAPAQR